MYTYHSLQRAEERTRFNGKAARRFIENGLTRGKTADDYTKEERRYLSSIAYDDCIAKAYNGYCLIISSDGDCVTLYPLPDWFGKKKHYDGKTQIRNVKRYAAAYAAY